MWQEKYQQEDVHTAIQIKKQTQQTYICDAQKGH